MYSFSFQTTEGNNALDNNKGTERETSSAQIKFYLDLCTQRNVEPKNYLNMNYNQLDKEIKELKSFYPASQSQKDLIIKKIESLTKAGVNIKTPDLTKLTGGRQGSASKLIEKLIQMEKEITITLPPSEYQLKFMVNMFLCPDVGFEEYGIERKIPINHLESYSSDVNYEEQTANQLWRKPTPEEFAEMIKRKMNKSQASKFIDKYKVEFSKWKESRIKIEQMKYIRTLEERLSNTTSTNAIEFAVDIDGNIEEVVTQVKDKAKQWSPEGYTPLEEIELLQFSSVEASKYITILEKDLKRKESNEDNNIEIMFDDNNEKMRNKGEEVYNKEQFEKLKDLIFKLEALAGYETGLHEKITSLLAEDINSEETKKEIMDFMNNLIANDCISFDNLLEMVDKVDIAKQLLLENEY